MKHARALVIDDHFAEIIVEYLERTAPDLRDRGLALEALAAPTYSMAIRLLQEDCFDLIISDFTLDEADGGALIRRVRHGEFVRDGLGTPLDVPAIVMTAHAYQPFAREAMYRDGFDIVLSPIPPNGLIDYIFAALNIGGQTFPSRG